MKLSEVAMKHTVYDPATDKEGALGGRSGFCEPDYAITLDGGVLCVTSVATGRTAVYDRGAMAHAIAVPLVDGPQPVVATVRRRQALPREAG